MALTVSADALLEVSDLGQRRVLAARAEQIAEAVERDAAVAALVKERKCLFVVCGRLRVVLVGRHYGGRWRWRKGAGEGSKGVV